MHICQSCAKARTEVFQEQFNISDFLGGLLDISDSQKKEEDAVCPLCGLTFANFKKKGRFGCAGCYEAFRKQLLPLLKRIHSADHHVGKTPGKPLMRADGEEKAKELRDRLERAIRLEDYEEAARLRDQLGGLEQRKSQG
jgi:protein arginine kinase activator